MFTRSINRILRQTVLAFYVLALVLPGVVQAGVQLEPTAIYLLEQDLAQSRCANGGEPKIDHHDNGECCVLCAALQLPDAPVALAPVDFPENKIASTHIIAQTIGLKLGLASRPPIPRGPPA